MSAIARRAFLGRVAAASAFTIVPRRVLGGRGHVAPSDMLRLAQVGCGTQALRQVNTNLVRRPDVQFVAVVDPNRSSDDYVDWSPFGTRATVRKFLGNATWCEGDRATRAGRAVAREVMETWYRQQGRPAAGIHEYEDFREMLARESDIQGVVNITPDHQHAVINIATLRAGKAAISHKPVGATMHEVQQTLRAANESAAVSHLLAYSNRPDRHTLAAWIAAGAIGTVREVHNWTNRPFWPQGMQDYPTEAVAVPAGFNWALWQGPEPDRPYHPTLTHTVYRGWYAYGTGCLGDMGHYSLWQPYRILELGVPEWVEARPNNEAAVSAARVSRGGRVSPVAFPKASTIRWRHPATARRAAVDSFWYDGGMKPATPDELLEDNEDLADEGMLLIGDAGKILCDFRANAPRLLPKRRQAAFAGTVTVPAYDQTAPDDEWTGAIRGARRSSGSFEAVGPLAKAVALAGIALRIPYKRLLWDDGAGRFSNNDDANRLVRREAYRDGWGSIVG